MSFLRLPLFARLYVAAVVVAGCAAIAAAIVQDRNPHPVVFAVLLGLSLGASIAKVTIPVPGSDSSLTVCHVVDYAALVICGPDAAVLVAAWGGWTQCTFRSHGKNPVHQIVFSITSLALAMFAAGAVHRWVDGAPGTWTGVPQLEPFTAAATVFFILNSGFVAAAVALSTGKSISIVWFESFLSSWPSYSIGALLAAAIATVLDRRAFWLIPMLAGPLVLLHRNFTAYLERLNEALTDPLTRLPNQRYLLQHLERALARARYSRTPLAVVFLDLNGFKALNDNGGHATGDAALRLVAGKLRHAVRADDLCARYGGDEFVAVLNNCPRSEAQLRAEEMQSAVRALVVDGQTGFRMALSMSAGVAVYPEDGDTVESLFIAADRRMYQRKSADTGIHRMAGLHEVARPQAS